MTHKEQNTNQPENYAGKTRAEVEAYRQQYGADRVKLLRVGDQRVILRGPEPIEYNRYLQETLKVKERPEVAISAGKTLVMACLLAPSSEEVGKTLERYPALAEKLLDPVLNMAGADAEVVEETF